MNRLVLLAPIEPCKTGNGLAMRVASFVEAASESHDVTVAVLPVAGSLPYCPDRVEAPIKIIAPVDGRLLRRDFVELVSDPRWRRLLAETDPMPGRARAASPALARSVIEDTGAGPRTPVHVMRSYMAPLGLSVAEMLDSPWLTLDLDDDDESLARSMGETVEASSYDRLVATFAPLFSGVGLASPHDADAVGRRHNLSTTVIPNAVPIPERVESRWRSDDARLLFVANYGYSPNVEAASVLVDSVAPRVGELTGRNVHVLLVGNHSSDSLADFSERRDVSVVGFVESLGPWYSQADAVVAPLAHGSGTRIKLLEAFAHGVPVVTTPTGASGLDVADMEELFLGRTTEELAQAAARLLDDEQLVRRIAGAAFEFVRKNHSQAVVNGVVEKFFQAAAQTGRVS